MSKIKQLLIVFPICLVLAGLAVLIYLLDPTFAPDLYRVASMVIVVSWAFFIVPALLFDVKLAIDYFEGKTPEHAFRRGVLIGVVLGIGGLIILFLLFSPIGGTIWFIQTIKQINVSIKQKKDTKSNESDIFDI